MRNLILLSALLFSLSSCYNYDGPIRKKGTYPTYYETHGENGPSSKRSILGKYLSRKTKTTKTSAAVLDVNPNISSKEYLNNIVEDIKRTLPSAQVSLIEDSIKVLFPDNIRFGNSAVMPNEDISDKMSKLAKLLIKYDQTNVLVTGHTDNIGSEKINKRISELRAQYIKDLLLAYKVPNSRLNSWGLGGSSPIASNRTKEGIKKNRRVEFVILSTIQDDEEL
jgi:outer membrane protein OmpA-like peptidoglycan-associated protein